MEIEVFEAPYQVNLGKSGHFEFNGFRINKVLFANIRSLKGQIGDVSFDKEILKKNIMDFLRVGTNVELVNILSRGLNGFNYFEIYEESTSINKDLKIEDILSKFEVSAYADTSNLDSISSNSNDSSQDLKIEDVLGENELPASAVTSYLDSIKSKSKNSPHLIPSEVISHINPNIPLYKCIEIDKFNFYPIWYINGKKNDGKCELFCHFNILIHLLSKVFIEFKSQILDLVGTDIQKAVARDQTVEKYLALSKDELITRLKMIEATNSNLAKEKLSLLDEIKRMREESREQLAQVNEQLAHSNEQLTQVNEQLAQSREQLNQSNEQLAHSNEQLAQSNEQLTDMNTKLTVANTKIDNLIDLVSTTTERAINSLDSLSTQLNESLPNSILTTGTTQELLIIFRCNSLENEMRDKGLIGSNESVFDTIACQAKDKTRSLEFHKFDKLTDEIVREYSISNSIDLSKFIRNNATPDQAKFYSTQTHIRKLVYNRNYENTLLERLDRYANSVADVRIEINQSIQNSQANLRIGTRDDLNRVVQAVERIEFRQMKQENEIHEIREEQKQIITTLEQLSRFVNTSIVVPGRARRLKLYMNQQGKLFINIDRKRHYISDDEANQILKFNK